jgi:hypothetical protein
MPWQGRPCPQRGTQRWAARLSVLLLPPLLLACWLLGGPPADVAWPSHPPF